MRHIRSFRQRRLCKVNGELEITAFAGDEGEKRMTFRVLANTYRILGNGRATVVSEASAEE